MTLDFQKNLLNQLLLNKEYKPFLKDVDIELFDLAQHKFILSSAKEYVKKYKAVPTLTNFIQFIDDEVKGETDLTAINAVIEELFGLEVEDSQQLKSKVLESVKNKKLKNLLKENIGADASDAKVNAMLKELKQIDAIGRVSEDVRPPIKSISDLALPDRTRVRAHPSYLEGLNALTTKGGFAPPELITFLGAPKSFKTGTLINLGAEYCMSGLNVLYVDWENGDENVLTRFQQKLACATYEEMMDGECDDVLIQMMQKIKRLGGEFIIQSFQANYHSLDDVDALITELAAQGIHINMVCYDYLDLAACADKSIREDTHKIQHIYHHAISLNKKHDMFAITPSQVHRAAVEKEFIDMKDFARDFGKAMNVHAAFAIMRTPEEAEAGIARIGVVVQRMGKKPTKDKERQVYIRIEEATMQVTEIPYPDDIQILPKEANFTGLY